MDKETWEELVTAEVPHKMIFAEQGSIIVVSARIFAALMKQRPKTAKLEVQERALIILPLRPKV